MKHDGSLEPDNSDDACSSTVGLTSAPLNTKCGWQCPLTSDGSDPIALVATDGVDTYQCWYEDQESEGNLIYCPYSLVSTIFGPASLYSPHILRRNQAVCSTESQTLAARGASPTGASQVLLGDTALRITLRLGSVSDAHEDRCSRTQSRQRRRRRCAYHWRLGRDGCWASIGGSGTGFRFGGLPGFSPI